MTNTIMADNQELLEQAPMTAEVYLRAAVRCIDNLLGAGYAKEHPELIVGFMQTAAAELGSAAIAQASKTKPPVESI
jgi:hypothetical protein